MLVIKNKKKFIRGITIIIVFMAIIITSFAFLISGIISLFKKEEVGTVQASETQKVENDVNTVYTQNNINNTANNTVQQENTEAIATINKEDINKWNLKLVNKDNSVDRNYVPELEEISDGVKFDKRAIKNLKNMINAMYNAGITKVWVQSAYRSYAKQEELFNNKVKYYKQKGKTQEEAQRLAQTIVQRPEMSEHNLALAADFNTVTNEFEDTKAFEWLKKNAQDYGFILRYPKDKQEITGITYESWHWRYVGQEHAKVIKEKNYCLEEYIEYLKGNQAV